MPYLYLTEFFSVRPALEEGRHDAHAHDKDGGRQVVDHHRADDEPRLRPQAVAVVAAVQSNLKRTKREAILKSLRKDLTLGLVLSSR